MLMDILNRIQERLDAVGLSANAASVKAGISKDAIRNIQRACKSGRDGISITTLIKLAPVLQTTPSWLLEGSSNANQFRVPKISWVSAGAFDTADTVHSFDEFPTIETSGLPDGDWVALEVQGDSMDRISPPGSVIFVNRADRKLSHNACYIIQDVDGSATYKRYRQSPMRFEPVSTNPEHETIYPNDNSTPNVFGRVSRSVIEM
ncbi:phage repressor protein [Agrobacterium vitis]|uniref:LexA family transcriptional regulator n=2 Tax=Agrobacterium vitis TaxID=373 RepID=UPI0012E99032|nr:LexA family transcriptional regulator [Agrobacterium vitis]MUZ63223.1 phage repressor protein [Agrobacterium vitis]MVA27869.1 phage repressor protein [Agrobacterium vitis]